MGLRFALSATLALACWFASGAQQILIYEHVGTTGGKQPDPGHGDNVLIWENGCLRGESARCTRTRAQEITRRVTEVKDAVGEPVGPEGVVNVIVYGAGKKSAARNGSYSPVYNTIQLPHDWSPHAVYHETGHTFFDGKIGSTSCAGSGCNKEIMEHWGLDEGIAFTLQDVLSGGAPRILRSAGTRVSPIIAANGMNQNGAH